MVASAMLDFLDANEGKVALSASTILIARAASGEIVGQSTQVSSNSVGRGEGDPRDRKLVNALFASVMKAEREVLEIATQKFSTADYELTDEAIEAIRTNALADLAIAALSVIKVTRPARQAPETEYLDELILRVSSTVQHISAVGFGHCASREEAAEFFSELAVGSDVVVNPLEAASTRLDGATIVLGLYRVRLQRHMSFIVDRWTNPLGMPGAIAELLAQDCFGERDGNLHFLATNFVSELVESARAS